MFKKDSQGSLYYESKKRRYYLLDGYTNNNLTSDIVFIIYYEDYEYNIKTKLVDFIYGGFSDLNAIEETIKNYESNEVANNDK